MSERVLLLFGCVLRKCSWIFGVLFIMHTHTKKGNKINRDDKGLVLINNLKLVSPF